MKRTVNVAIYASGRGSNAQAIHQYTQENDASFHVKAILSNKKSAGVLDFANQHGIASKYLSTANFSDELFHLEYLFDMDIDLIVLAGFLKLIPPFLINAYPGRIINIHPSLLPKYGGKGMYGMNVHQAVKANNEPHSGMTIHYVNEAYDEGQVIFQAQCKLSHEEQATTIASKVLRLEHSFYPEVVNGIASKLT